MTRVTLAGLRTRFGRMVMIALAIALGVGFVSGTFALTDAMRTALYETAAKQAENVAAHAELTATEAGQPDSRSASAFSDRDIGALEKLPGVAAVQPRAFGTVQVLGPDGRAVRDLGNSSLFAFVAPVDPRLGADTLASGRFPIRRGELVLTSDLAGDGHWKPGTELQVLDSRGRTHPFRLAGTVDGTPGDGVLGLLPADFKAFAAEGAWSGWYELDVLAAPGAAGTAAEQEVTTRVASALGRKASVISGSAYADKLANDAVRDLEMFTLGLLLFAGIALVVAAIVIYNTFTILLAQRQRELALLRCVGASRGQVFRGVMLESAALGLLASGFGFVVGYALAAAAFAGMRAFGAPLGDGIPLTVSGTAAVAAFLVGVGVTMASALLPARGATRVAPVSALSAQPELVESRRTGRLRVAVGTLLMLGGAGAAALGALARAAVLGFAGGVLILLALLVLGPVVVTPVGRLVGWLPARLFGAPGVLAAANGARNPRRMSAATNALTLGVGLVCVFLVGAESAKVSANAELESAFPVDFVVDADYGKHLPADVSAKLRARPEVGEVAPVLVREGSIGSVTTDVTGLAPSVLARHLPSGAVVAGDVARVGTGSVVLDTETAKTAGAATVGSQVTVKGPHGRARFRVAALVGESFSGSAGSVILSPADHAKLFGRATPDRVLVWKKSGVSAKAARDAVASVTDRLPSVSVKDSAAEKEENGRMIDTLLAVVGVLMALSIIIAVVGIGITLTLSVVERTRESGMLRALGLTRRQLYGTLVLEAVIMAMIAAVLGIVLGVSLGIAGFYSLVPHKDALVAVPVERVGLVVLAAAVAGVLAALLPARRSARVSPVAALAAD